MGSWYRHSRKGAQEFEEANIAYPPHLCCDSVSSQPISRNNDVQHKLLSDALVCRKSPDS